MKRAIIPVELPHREMEINIELNEPGNIRHFIMQLRPRKVLVGVSLEQPAQMVEEVPFLLVEVDPDLPKRMRHFLIVATGDVIESKDGSALEFRTSVPSRNGQVFHLFERIPS